MVFNSCFRYTFFLNNNLFNYEEKGDMKNLKQNLTWENNFNIITTIKQILTKIIDWKERDGKEHIMYKE